METSGTASSDTLRDKFRITVYPNGTRSSGKVVFVYRNEDWKDLLGRISDRLSREIIKLYNEDGGEVESQEYIEVDDVLFASSGENFIFPAHSDKDWVTLNVGGKIFSTTRSTLTADRDSMLSKMFNNEWGSKRDIDGSYLIDRTPEYFAPILNFLRCGSLTIDDATNVEGVLEEAKFFNMTILLEPLKALVDRRRRKHTSLTRKEFVSILLTSSINSSLRCQGLDLAEVDLSKLDLSHINFKMTNFRKANLERSNLDNAQLCESNLSESNLQFASFRGSDLKGANLEGANLRGANFEDRGGIKATLEGAKLKGASLEDCNFSGANLRAANLRGCNLENANLRRADLAGADLEGVNLKGANLNKANLIGANLAQAHFDIRTTTPWG